jgi:formylglycine-generating enzyme required for sulfatase activity
MKKKLAILLLVGLFVGSELQAQDVAKPLLRTWEDSTGQFSIAATFVRVNGDLVVLQGINKKEISLPLIKLSAADQRYVNARLTYGNNAKKTITNTIGMKLNLIPAGTFMMGSPVTEEGREAIHIGSEGQHKVTISKAFYIQTTEVTQGQWKAVMGTEPWKGKSYVKEGPNYAASYVSRNDAVAFSKKLSSNEGKMYRLPTEAEWEYACRAGTKTRWSFGDDEKELGDYAWHFDNTHGVDDRYPHQVGLKKPNAFGLYDMHGNIGEWCSDWYGADYYQQSREKDPQGPLKVQSEKEGGFKLLGRVLRGGAWTGSGEYQFRSANRFWGTVHHPATTSGFRVVRELD